MIITGIDTGENTGVCVVRVTKVDDLHFTHTVLRSETYPIEDFQGTLEPLPREVVVSNIAIVEGIPSHSKFHLLQLRKRVEDLLTAKVVKMTTIYPSEWKPVSKGRGWSNPIARTQHEKDAYNMIMFYVFSRLRLLEENKL
jgi:hypothetical protein